MRPADRFLRKPKTFWAAVRSLSQKVGYSKGDRIIVPSVDEMKNAFSVMDFDIANLEVQGQQTDLCLDLLDYFTERARVLMCEVEPNLLNAEEARNLFERIRGEFHPKCPIPMNKQRGDKKAEAFLTALVNMMIERYSEGLPCNYDPRELTSITLGGAPLRTLARRVDGAFPSVINPIAVWEIKEYYYTTTFGSRVADGVYETLLDGMEIEEIRKNEDIDVKHYLMADAHYTWWICGKSVSMQNV